MTMKLAKKTAPSRKRNDKGFSLIELIIVITIMAILTALVAPQLLRYVEQARVAKDRATMDEVLRACNLSLTNQFVDPSGRMWYAPNGTIPNVRQTLAEELALILGGTARPNGTWWIVEGLPPLQSKLYQENYSSAYPTSRGRQVFFFTQTIVNKVLVDITVVYENDPFK